MDMPTATPDIEIAGSISAACRTQQEAQVIVHITYRCRTLFAGIRIWPTTYLLPAEGGPRSSLLHAENIALAPRWTILFPGDYRFTLIFSALPADCVRFHLWEDIDQPHGFYIPDIARTHTDIYHLALADTPS